MSENPRPGWLLSEDEVFDWLKAEPRTYDWQVLLALDRAKANELLRQDYTARYSKDLYFDPITDSVKIADGNTQVWEYLYEHVLGPPRLSFENSDTDEWARLTMPILGGVQLKVEQTGMGPKMVSSISWYDPLQSPRLICEIQLEDTAGEVNDGREVELDLKKGTNFRLTFASTFQGQKKGGEFYEELFEKLDEDKQRFLLGRLDEFSEGSVLQPDKFRLRALPAQPKGIGESEGASEGAILLFIGTKGNESGGLPDKDSKWVYPIPAGYSSTMLVAGSVIIRDLIAEGIAESGVVTPEYGFIYENGVVAGLRFSRGTLKPERIGLEIDGIDRPVDLSCWCFLFGNGEEEVFTINLAEEKLHMRWKYAGKPESSHVALMYLTGAQGHAYFFLQYSVESKYNFALDAEDESVVLNLEQADVIDVNVVTWDISDTMEEHRDALADVAKNVIKDELIELQHRIGSGIKELETFRLYGLLFSGGQAVLQKKVRLPRDLAVFGDISPVRTSFKLNPDEKDIIHGGSIDFQTTPAHSGLKWTLTEVPGFPGPLGSITQSGSYTAPAADQLPANRAYTMVRVTAASLDGNFESSALIRVVRRGVVVNPLVVSVPQSANKVRFSGGSLHGDKLTWSVKSATGGTLTDTPPEDDAAVFDESDMFYVPGTGSTGGYMSIDEISVTDATGNVAISHLVVLEKPLMGALVIMPGDGLPEEGQVQFGLDTGTEVLTDEATWTVLAGGGSIDTNGIYTPDPNSDFAYAVVSGVFEIPPYVSFNAFSILPIPLVDLDEIQRIIR